MRTKSAYLTILFCSLTIFSWLILTEAHPVDDDVDSFLGFTSNEVSKDTGSVDGTQSQPTTRPKRTIGFLRQLFPGLSQIIDRKIQAITRVVFRVVGRLILRGGNRNGGGSTGSDSSGGSGGRRISITLPTYPPIEDEDEETEAPTESTILPDLRFDASNQSSTVENDTSSSSSTTSSSDSAASTDMPESNTIVRKTRDVSDGSETTVSFDDELTSSSEASTKKQGLLQRLGNEMRKKRGSLGSGGGSGNFIFDLIRLVAGSGVSPEKDEELNAPREERDENSVDGTDPTRSSDNTEDNYSAGIPGPLTRLFVLANRGLSNLIQDLILLCPDQTSKCKLYSSKIVDNVSNDIHSS